MNPCGLLSVFSWKWIYCSVATVIPAGHRGKRFWCLKKGVCSSWPGGADSCAPVLQMSSNVRLMSHRLIIFILSEPFQPPIHPNGSQWRTSCNSSSRLKAFGKGPCKNPSPQSPRRAQICLWSLSTAPRTVAALPTATQPLPAFRGWHSDALSTRLQPSLHTG